MAVVVVVLNECSASRQAGRQAGKQESSPSVRLAGRQAGRKKARKEGRKLGRASAAIAWQVDILPTTGTDSAEGSEATGKHRNATTKWWAR